MTITINSPTTLEPDDSGKVWRYMNFARFVWMLQNKQLWLSRADLLGDPWELAPSHQQFAMARMVTGLNVVEPTLMGSPTAFETIVNTWRNRTFVSCWTAQEHESHALWRIYCGPTEGVAVHTTLARLKQSTNGIPVERVIYRDPEARPPTPTITLTGLALEKRPMFGYEHEVRIIYKVAAPSPEREHRLPWDPGTVVENIYVHPDADRSFMDTVRAIVAQYAPTLTPGVRWSAMQARPPF